VARPEAGKSDRAENCVEPARRRGLLRHGTDRIAEYSRGNAGHRRDSITLEGFTHLIPFAAGHELPGHGGASWS
jgi:hypothetical protein